MEGFFGEIPVGPEQAASIARGLYALARVDGHDQREGMLIQSLWMDAIGSNIPVPLREVQSAADVTPAELAKQLPTPELRKLFLKTAILLSWADSVVSPQEKAWIAKVAKEFGIADKDVARMDEQVRNWLLSQLTHISNVDAVKDVAKKLGF